MKPQKTTRAKRAKIQKIAAICLGLLFAVLFIRMIAAEDDRPSLPKRAALEEGCHRRISQVFAGAPRELEEACRKLDGIPVADGHSADLAYRFQPLPKMPLLLLFWDEDREEGFEAQSKILFDEYALEYLDLEGLTFVAEKLAENLILMKNEKGGT